MKTKKLVSVLLPAMLVAVIVLAGAAYQSASAELNGAPATGDWDDPPPSHGTRLSFADWDEVVSGNADGIGAEMWCRTSRNRGGRTFFSTNPTYKWDSGKFVVTSYLEPVRCSYSTILGTGYAVMEPRLFKARAVRVCYGPDPYRQKCWAR